jgi:hypothetical protein
MRIPSVPLAVTLRAELFSTSLGLARRLRGESTRARNNGPHLFAPECNPSRTRNVKRCPRALPASGPEALSLDMDLNVGRGKSTQNAIPPEIRRRMDDIRRRA